MLQEPLVESKARKLLLQIRFFSLGKIARERNSEMQPFEQPHHVKLPDQNFHQHFRHKSSITGNFSQPRSFEKSRVNIIDYL